MIKRGELYFADLNPTVGSEQGGFRPVLVIQNDVGNRYSPTVIVAAVTTKNKTRLPTHILLSVTDQSLERDSYVLLEQIRTIDKSRLNKRIGYVDKKTMRRVDMALQVSLGVVNPLRDD